MKFPFLKILIGLTFICACSNPTKYIDLQYIEGGTFTMGSDDESAESDERPPHMTEVRSFYLCKYEVSQKLWVKIMKINPSYFQDPDNPVESVSHEDIQLFLERLNSMTGKKYRLPTEVEWEYAAKGGKYHNNHNYSGGDILDNVGWHKNNSEEKTHHIGTLAPNQLGIYDMTGNVHEWCQNVYDGTDYANNTVTHVDYDLYFVFRGGSFYSDSTHCRITNRNHAIFNARNFSLGFRLAHDIEN